MANTAASDFPRRVAVLDLGSNTVLLLTLERGGRVLQDDAKITRLGRGVFESGRLDPETRERTRRVALDFARRARDAGAELVVAVGTEALRRAEDGSRFLAELLEEGPLDQARLLSGQEEAELAIEASRRVAHDEPLTLLDVGGGSTELAWLEGDRVRALSLPLGSVRLTEAWITRHPVPREELRRLRAAIRDGIPTLEVPRGTLVAVAGTATTLAALDQALDPYDGQRVEGYRVSAARLSHWAERLAGLGLAERRALPGLEPARADVIVAGLLILEELQRALGARELRTSGRGVRHGLALRLLDAPTPV